MKRGLILHSHGLGDIILLTPHLRFLYKKGYKIDLMCRPAVRQSKLLDACPYINKLIDVPNPWRSELGYDRQADANMTKFYNLKDKYDWSGAAPHQRPFLQDHKIDINSYELELEIEDKKLEVFPPTLMTTPSGYIFTHTHPEPHPYHNWDATDWIEENLPDLPIIYAFELEKISDDINHTFIMMQRASHRVLSSSVFVHACEAMGCVIDVINYGRPDRKVWPLDQSRVLHIREDGKWIK